jgi:hypothetical protein
VVTFVTFVVWGCLACITYDLNTVKCNLSEMMMHCVYDGDLLIKSYMIHKTFTDDFSVKIK